MRSSDWSSDVCSSDLVAFGVVVGIQRGGGLPARQRRLEIVPACMRPRLQGIEAGHPVRALAGAEFLVDAERDIDQVQRLVDTALLVDHCREAIGRASCRERECQYVSSTVVAESLKKNNKNKIISTK